MFGITPEHLNNTKKLRNRELVVIRQLIFYFLRKYTKLSYAQIGKIYNKNHATVIYACSLITDLLKNDKLINHYHDFIDPVAFEMLYDNKIIRRYAPYEILNLMGEIFEESQINQFKNKLYEQSN